MPLSLSVENRSRQSVGELIEQAALEAENVVALAVDVSNRDCISHIRGKIDNKKSKVNKGNVEYVGERLRSLLAQHRHIINSSRYDELYNKFLDFTVLKEKTVARELPHVARHILDLTALVVSEYQIKETESKNGVYLNNAKQITTLLSFQSVVASLKEWRDGYKRVAGIKDHILRAEHMQNFFPLFKEFRKQLESTAESASIADRIRGQRKAIFSSEVKRSTKVLREYLRDQLFLTLTLVHPLHELTTQNFVNFNYQLHKQFENQYFRLQDRCDANEYHSLIASMAMLETMKTVREFEEDKKKRSADRQVVEEAQKRRLRREEEAQWAAEISRQVELSDMAREKKQAYDAERADHRQRDAEHYLARKDALRAQLEFESEWHDNERKRAAAVSANAKARAEAEADTKAKASANAGNHGTTHRSRSNPSRALIPAASHLENATNTTFTSNGTAYPVVNVVTGEPAVVLKKDTIYETKNADGTTESYKTSEVLPIRVSYIDNKAVGARHGPLDPGAYRSTGKRIEFPGTSGKVGATAHPSTSAADPNRIQPYPVQQASLPYKASPGHSAQIDLRGAHSQVSYQLPKHLSRAVLAAVSAPPVAFDRESAVHIASRSTPRSTAVMPESMSTSTSDEGHVRTTLPTSDASSRKLTRSDAVNSVPSGAVLTPLFGVKKENRRTAVPQDNRRLAPGHDAPGESSPAFPSGAVRRPVFPSAVAIGVPPTQTKITPEQLTAALKMAEVGLRCLALDWEHKGPGVEPYTRYAQRFLKHLNTKGVQQDIHAFPGNTYSPPVETKSAAGSAACTASSTNPTSVGMQGPQAVSAIDEPTPSGSRGESSKRPSSPSQESESNKKHHINPQTDPQNTVPDASLNRYDSLEALAQGDHIEQSAQNFFGAHPERAVLLAAVKSAFKRIGEKKLRRANRDDLRHLWVRDRIAENRAAIRKIVLENCVDFTNEEMAEQRVEHGKGVAAFYEENTDTAAYCGEISNLFMAYIRESHPALSGNFFMISVEQSKENADGEIVPLGEEGNNNGSHAFILYTESEDAKAEIAESYNDDEDIGYYSEMLLEDFANLIFEHKDRSLIIDSWGTNKLVDISLADGSKDVRAELKRLIRGAGLDYNVNANKLLLFAEDDPGNVYP